MNSRIWTFLATVFICLQPGISVAQLGDFDADGDWDCHDIDTLAQAIVTDESDLRFDLNSDGNVDADDGAAWLVLAGSQNLSSGLPYLPGDGNLDGVVDVSDFMLWNANKFTHTPGWCQANFSFDSVVDIRDFNWWNDHKFLSSGRLIDHSTHPSILDGAVDFYYDSTTGVMSIDPNGLEIWCFSVFGIEPESFLLNGAGIVDADLSIWIQDFFAGHSKWFSLDVSPVEATAIAQFDVGLTADAFDYVTFGTPDGLMGRGEVTILNDVQIVPEPSSTSLFFIAIVLILGRRASLRVRFPST